MRLSEYCSSQDIDRAIAVTVDSFVASQKVSCKRALARAFAKYVSNFFFLSPSPSSPFCFFPSWIELRNARYRGFPESGFFADFVLRC